MKGGRQKVRETSVCERHTDWFPLTCVPTRDWPATHACAVTGNRTSDHLLCGTMLNQLSYASKGQNKLSNSHLWATALKHLFIIKKQHKLLKLLKAA